MITYLLIRESIIDAYDYSDLISSFMLLPLFILLDILFFIFQPFMYLLYKAWKEENQ